MTTTVLLASLAGVGGPAAALARDPEVQSGRSAAAGGAEFGTAAPTGPTPVVPGSVAQIIGGIAYAPEEAPDTVKQAIWAGNALIGMPYVYGGGHGGFDRLDSGYDCSGTISWALHGGALLARPRDSSAFFRYGSAGRGSWITIFTNPGHAYMTVAGIRLDTSAADDPGGAKGPRWRPLRRSDRGFKVRHPVGL
jgi:hypothetical protein